ncbi:MAG: UDP-N-acetylmuramoyl-L-alanine--D-glutamate ligase [Pseudomonadota bacterium]
MIALTTYAGRRVAVFGLGRSGLATARALLEGGAEVIVWDDKPERIDAARAAGFSASDLANTDFITLDALVLAPGVPLTHPEPHWTVGRAHAAGIPIIGDVELFDTERRARFPQQRLVAITGTNGKSTTTALAGHLLAAMGESVQVGGNIGRPALDLSDDAAFTVLEVSSFQIDLAPSLTADVGVLLNITSDHLDRHGSFENYAAIKTSLTDRAQAVVLNHHSQIPNSYARGHQRNALEGQPTFAFATDKCQARAQFPREHGFSTRDVFGDVDYHGGIAIAHRVECQEFSDPPHLRNIPVGWDIYTERSGESEGPFAPLPEVPSLRGTHNVDNAGAALAIVQALGLDVTAAIPHLATFPGLPHRMEEVGVAGGVRFINDSKATNLDSAVTALKALPAIYWIAGGKPKLGGVEGLKIENYDIRAAFLIGQAEAEFAATLDGKLPITRCGTLDVALDAAAAAARAAGGGTVLLSPACASFDQFPSFEARGDTFRDLVKNRLNKEIA